MGLKKNPQTRTRPDPIVYIYIYILKYLYIYIFIYIVINPKISIPHFISAHNQTTRLLSLQLTNTTLTHSLTNHNLIHSQSHCWLTTQPLSVALAFTTNLTLIAILIFRCHPKLSPPPKLCQCHWLTAGLGLFCSLLLFKFVFLFDIDVLGLFCSIAKSNVFDFSLHLPKSLRGVLWVNCLVLYLVGILLIPWICRVPFPKQRHVF